MKKPFARTLFACLLATCLPATFVLGQAQPAPVPPAAIASDTNIILSATAAKSRAAWQEHLTLGPGDVLNFALYADNAPTEVWQNIAVGPDGRINYLEARDIMATGLSIDELRSAVDAALQRSSNYFTPPHSIITPVALISKKYVVLGAVVNKGVFTLDRPLTLMEAIARAGGLETGVLDRDTVELADLSHSFIVRHGQHLPLDFEKLFQQGDLSQNIPLEPNDYIYFASSGANEVYVLGEVLAPGAAPYSSSASVIGAITTRGGFTAAAYRQRVLVIRGSLEHPETFVVDAADILKGKNSNFRLKSRDIVYVAQKPWQKAEEFLDAGTRAFIQAFIVTYTGDKVGPFIDPIVH